VKDLGSVFWVHFLLGVAFLILSLGIPEIGIPLPKWVIYTGLVVACFLIALAARAARMPASSKPALGGPGGTARVAGDYSRALGGDGGSGAAAEGGRGGDAEVIGNRSFAAGGKGGNATGACAPD
jgi:hypothetical protein